MGELLGEAYVEIRPEVSRFESQLTAGIKKPLLNVAKLVTAAFAVKGGFDFGKGLVEDAARVQKSTETIRDEFGVAGKSIIDFADTAGIHLGIASHASEEAAARFGVLFKNLGIGKTQAAEMTVNLEDLAGSIAAIRGKDPAQILGTLPLALSGSLRGLRQLGFAFDQNQLKNEALQLGLIRTKQQAVDPGAKALAIYGLLTKNLGDYQAQAALHANDAYNVQKRLSAEADHAKEVFGTELLPVIDKYGVQLSDFIDKTVKSGEAQHDFNAIVDATKTVISDVAAVVKDGVGAFHLFSDAVGGDHNAVKILADAFGLLYAKSKLVKWGVIAGGEKEVGGAAAISAGQVDGLKGSLAKLKGAGPFIIPIALSFIPPSKKGQEDLDKAGIGFLGHLPFIGGAEQQIARAGQATHDFVFGADKTAASITGAKKKIADAIQSPFLTNTFAQAKIANPNITRAQYDLARQIAESVKSVGKSGPVKSAATDTGAAVGKAMADGVDQGAPRLKQSVLDALKQPVDAAREALTAARQQLATDITDSANQITASVQQAKQNLSSLAASLASDVNGFLAAKGDQPEALGGVLQGRLKQLLAQIHSGTATTQTVSLAKELENQIVARAQLPKPDASAAVSKRLDDASFRLNSGKLGVKGFDRQIDQILKSAGVTAAVIARTQGVAAAGKFQADIAGAKAQAEAIAKGPQRPGSGLESTIVKPLEVLRTQELRISDDRKSEARAAAAVGRAQLTEQKKQTALLEKIDAKQPSKHETAQLEKLLRGQNGLSPTSKRARATGTNRQGR